MAKDESKLQVNVDFTEYPELYAKLMEMVEADMTDRSKFMRRLVSQESTRRQQSPLLPTVDSGVKAKVSPTEKQSNVKRSPASIVAA